MFSVRLVTADSYQAPPLPQLDPTYSEFRGAEIKNVPIVRIFGTTPTGEKTCLHLHGAFPYMYVPFTGEDNANAYAYKLAASLDAAINISLGSATSNTPHVYQIQRVAGIPYYGYHRREHQFFKVSFYNPAMMKKATDLLQNGSVLNHRLQTHEAHIPYILQFMMDYNLHGMSLINLSNVKYRRVTQLSETKPSDDSAISPVESIDYLPSSVIRQSSCEFEVDALVSDILNRRELERGMELNPGLAAIWEEERERRLHVGLPSDNSHLVNPPSPKRPAYCATESDIYQQQRLNRRLQMISQCDESILSTGTNPTPYPLEVNDKDHLINASNLGSCSGNNLDKSQQQLSDSTSLTSFTASQGSKTSQSTHDSSVLDPDDIPLVEMLMELACDSDNQESIDDDSILGTQSSMFNNDENKSDNEDEDAADLNITCLELDSMSPWDDTEKSPSQLVPVNILEVNTEVPQSSLGEIFAQDTDAESQDSEESRLPQLDGAGDLSSYLESEEDESTKRCQELKRVSECETPILNHNLSHSDDEAFIVEDLISGLSKSNKNGNSNAALIPNATWPSYLPNETGLEQFSTINYEPLSSVLESDFDNIIGMLLSNNDETTVGINLTVEDEGIPIEAVLNGDPCFTQTAEMDKSDFAELQDQYESLLDSALVPDVYKNSHDSDIVNDHYNRLEEKEMALFNTRNLRFTTDSRNSNLSSENVTPNIQEPDAKVSKNKLSLPSVFEKIDDSCKESNRLHSDSSDYNCNVVATWEELQDPKFIPKRILKKKRFGKTRKQVLTRRPILSDSMLARKKGRFRRGPTSVNSDIVQDNVMHILNSSSNTPMEVVPSQINDEAKESYSCERLTANDCTNTTVDTTRESSEESSKIESSSEDLSHDVASSGINDVPTRISPVNIVDNDVTKHILHEIPPSNSLPDVRNTLPGVQYSTYHVGENGNVTPILADFEELVDVPSENNKSLDNNNSENFSHYSSTRSHSGVIPFSKHKHRHCYYSLMRMRLIKKYVFTSDEIWVVEKRGKTRSLSSKVCNKNCRLPFVPLKKLDIAKKSDIKMTQLSISEMGPENLNLSCDSSKIDVVKDNYDANNASILPQSKSPEIIEVENTLQNSKHDNKLIDTRQMNCKNDIKSDGNNICDKLQLMISDSTSTQSAQISSTQNHDHIVMSKDNEPVVIRRIFKDKIYDSKVGRKKRSIILKFDDKNNSDVVTLNGHTPKIVSLSIKKKNHEDESKSMIEHCIQPELIKKKQEQRKNIEYANAAVMTIMESNENEEICNEKNGNSVLTTFTMETKMQQLRNPIINTINQDDAEISEIINRESNIISSSQCESAILIKRPEIWCSIDRNKIDLTHITQTNKLKNVEISNSQDNIQRTSPVCSKSITNLILDNNTDNIIVSKSDIPTNSHTQKFDDFDDTTLDVQLCDSIYKDDDTSNNIFEGTEAIGEPITSTDDCENVHESEQYTNAVAEVNLYAGKNYTIDAISLEIPQCLFEEDSNPESVQKKSSDMTDDNALTEKQLVEGLSSTETTLDDLISDDYDSVSTKAFNFGQEHKSDSDTLSILDNSSSTNEAQHEISMLSDAQESLTISQLAEIDDLINGNESSNDSNYTCMLSRSSTPEQLNGQLNCCNKSNEYFNEELITQMMKSILILRENNELPITDDFINDDDDDELPVDKEKSDYCASDDSSGNNSECLLKNIDENSAGSVSKYSPNKISMIRRIYSSKNKIVQKKSDYINVNTLHSAKSNVKDDKFSNNQIENLEIHETFKKNNSEEKLSDKEELVVNESYENVVSSAIDKCSSSNRNTATENILNDSTSDPQLYLRNNLNIATKSSENPCKSKMMNEFVHESNNNQVICQFEALTVEDNSISFANSVNQDSKQDMIAEKNQDLNSNHQHNDLTDKSLDNISEIVLNNEQYDNIHDDISPVVQLPTNNQYVKTDVIIEPNVRQKNLAEEVNVKVDENERENFRLLNDVDAKIESTVLKSDDEIAEKKIERNTVGVVASDNDSMLISMCRNVSIVLERLELNGLHKYLKHNQKIEACDTDMSKKMISVKNKDIQKTPTKRKQRVRFHEEVFVFESQERVPLIDVEDQVEESVNEKEQSEILIENQNLTEVSDVMDATKTEEFIGNAKSSIDSENTIVNCNEVISDAKISNNNDNDDITEMKNITIEKIKENKNEKKTVVENNCIEMAKINCEKPNGASIQNNIFNCNNKGIELLSIRNQESIKNEKVSRREPKVTNIIICRGEKCNSDAAVNQKENVLIKKFHKKSEEIEIKNTTRTMELCDKSKKKRDVDCVKEKPTLDVDNIQIKNNMMIDKFNKSWDNTSHDKPSTVNERKTKATNKKIYSNRSSVIPIDELKNCRSELQYKRKHTNISTMRTQSNTNNSINSIPLIGNITNQGSDRILRSYRTSSGYRNKIHTVSIDQKMIFTKVTISDQQLLKKTAKEKFLGHIGLCSLKPREYTWLPEHTMTGFIQLQQPNVVLQRLTPSVLKYYGYTRRFKSNRFGKRFKTSVDKFTIPAYDGPADLSSSDSEADDDITILNSEKRVCIYGSSKKNTKREVIVTPKKRKKSPNDNDDDDDEEKEMNECKQTKHGTPKQSIAALRTSYRSPHQRSILKSPNVSGNYSPLKIIISSPKANKSTPIDINASQINKSNVVTDINTTCCVTPKRRKQLMRKNLLRNRIKASSINGRKDNIRNAKMNTEHQLMD